ncbi:MAG: NAD(P)H-hydrate dehydratase [Alphaproteobacteria bacterium]|nr:NAD(P)H-hydrate dehydratase [Alphaproteobacteria bacterium]
MKERPLEILTNEQMAEADRLAVEMGVPSLTLMENAGRAVADEAEKLVDQARMQGGHLKGNQNARIVILCGPGNNGGDGFVAARLLKERGYDVAVYLHGSVEKLKGDAATNAKRWLEMGAVEAASTSILDGAGLLIDALFGTGLRRPIHANFELIELMAQPCAIGCPVLSVDIPSGVSEAFRIEASFQADVTVTFFRKKLSHLLYPGRALCGEVVLADIGIPSAVLTKIDPGFHENDFPLWLSGFPIPGRQSHKYERGHAVVVSGGGEKSGAARLGARAALRVGAGLVTVASPTDAVAANSSQLTAITIRPFEQSSQFAFLLEDKRINAVLVGPGCGVGQQTRDLVMVALASGAAVVLDADAITSFEADYHPLRDAIQAKPRRPVVLTPHRGELLRLLPKLGERKWYSNLGYARTAGTFLDAVVVAKGPDTVVAMPDNGPVAAINTNAPPWLATAGSGDVLAGLITGLLAQGMPAFEAACAAVWIHGDAAARFGPGLIAEDLPEMVPEVLRDLYARKQAHDDKERAAHRHSKCN